MKYKPRKFDNSDDAIERTKQEHKEAQEFVYGWLKHVGLEGCGSGLDFDDIFHLMYEYKIRCQGQTNIEWIPAVDRLPEPFDSVLCCMKNRYVVQLTYGRLVGFFDPNSVTNKVGKSNPVTHWMPLPEPPTSSTT